MNMIRKYYSNGKLMLSGEFLVLHGACSLVIPLKVGQQMEVVVTGHKENKVLYWQANILNEPWFFAHILISNWEILKSNNAAVAISLVNILKEAEKLNHLIFEPQTKYEITTDTAFNIDWGFGSSSALIANIANWAMIDPFELNSKVSGGSGADIAAAISDGPVLYKLTDNKPDFYRIDFSPVFLNNIWLVYTGNKQNTPASISRFKENASFSNKSIELIDSITQEMIRTDSLHDFMKLMSEHENILSEILGIPSVNSLMQDFPGEVKSLGAWGGDFIMAASEADDTTVREYFRSKHMHTIFTLDQILLQ